MCAMPSQLRHAGAIPPRSRALWQPLTVKIRIEGSPRIFSFAGFPQIQSHSAVKPWFPVALTMLWIVSYHVRSQCRGRITMNSMGLSARNKKKLTICGFKLVTSSVNPSEKVSRGHPAVPCCTACLPRRDSCALRDGVCRGKNRKRNRSLPSLLSPRSESKRLFCRLSSPAA